MSNSILLKCIFDRHAMYGPNNNPFLLNSLTICKNDKYATNFHYKNCISFYILNCESITCFCDESSFVILFKLLCTDILIDARILHIDQFQI